MPGELDTLLKAAIDEASRTGALPDIEKAAGIAKSIAEERKAATDLVASERTYRLSRLQGIMTGATVMVSVLGLAATGWYNIAQLSAARAQTETTEWRELVASLDETDDIAASVAIPFRIRSFSSSARYAADAKLLGALVMGRMANAAGFEQLYNFILGDRGEADLPTMLEIARQQRYSYVKVVAACHDLDGKFRFPPNRGDICWDGWTDQQVTSFGLRADDEKTWALRRRENETAAQLQFISARILEQLKKPAPRRAAAAIRLTGIHVLTGDLREFDFSGYDVSGSTFDAVLMENARLTPAKYAGVQFRSTDWWNAKTVDPVLLRELIATMYPRAWEGTLATYRRPTREEYAERVLALCQRVGLACDARDLRYEDFSDVMTPEKGTAAR